MRRRAHRRRLVDALTLFLAGKVAGFVGFLGLALFMNRLNENNLFSQYGMPYPFRVYAGLTYTSAQASYVGAIFLVSAFAMLVLLVRTLAVKLEGFASVAFSVLAMSSLFVPAALTRFALGPPTVDDRWMVLASHVMPFVIVVPLAALVAFDGFRTLPKRLAGPPALAG